MARFEFKLPDIGEGVAEGEIVSWRVKPGDRVVEDQEMVEVMTDKATVTIGAPRAGVIAEVRVDVGKVAKVGSVIVVIDTEAGASAAASTPAERAPDKRQEGPAATAVGDIREGLPGTSFFATKKAPAPAVPVQAASAGGGNGVAGAAEASAPIADDYFAEKPLATPATRKLARDLGLDLRRVRPTGPAGRVTKDDVKAFASGARGAAQPSAARARSHAQPAQPHQVARAPEVGPEERRPFVGIRRRIAERMQRSKNTAAHFTFVEECDVTRLKDVRARLKSRAEEQGVKLTFLPFIVKAVVASLKRHPMLNSMLDEATNELVLRRVYHIGVATATEQGLMVPVVRDADAKSILDIARDIDRLAEGARGGTLAAQELSGSTFTITSLGQQGGLFATPILNSPEVGILGVHQMKQKPVVRDGQIVIGDIMLLSLSFDHRIVDGHVGAAFAYEIIAYLEDPDRLLLEMV